MTKRSNKNRQRRALKAHARNQERLKSTETEPQKTTGAELVADDDGSGHLFDPHHIRRDARMVASILSLGVVSEDESKAILRKAFVLAAKSENCREYAAVMRVITTAAKVEIDAAPKRIAHAHAHAHVVSTPINADRSRLSEIAAKLGIR